jgi:hypothetical protein
MLPQAEYASNTGRRVCPVRENPKAYTAVPHYTTQSRTAELQATLGADMASILL